MADREDSSGLPDLPWVMPEWMEQYRELIEGGAGGNTAEDLLGRLRLGGARLHQTNIYVYMMAVEVDTKVRLLASLHDSGQLVGARPSTLAYPDVLEPCGCLTNERGWHRRNCPDWELVGPLSESNWLRRDREVAP